MLDSVLVDVFVTGSCGVGCGWLVWVVCLCGLVVAGSVGLVVVFGSRFGLSAFCVESLILAQDERWRRA